MNNESAISSALSSPPVVWITGLAGSGKTTIATLVHAQLSSHYQNVLQIDGDAVREICGNDLGHSPEDRIKNAYRLCRFAHYLNTQGMLVVCSTMSLYPEIWHWNRAHFPLYLEVYLRVTNETLHTRNKKSLYSTDNAGQGTHVVSLDLEFNEPEKPHLTLDNDTLQSQQHNVSQIIDAVTKLLNP